jgi:hypothetical protein
VTFTLNVQVAFAASVPPASTILEPPAVAFAVPDGHVVVAFGVPAIVTPVGNESVNATPLSETAPGPVFGIVMVKIDALPAAIVPGANAFASGMPAKPIVRFAVAGVEFVTPWVVFRASATIVFVYVAAAVPVTFTLIVQVPLAASVPPVSAILEPPPVAVAVPAGHVVEAFGVAATVTPVGNVSVRATLESATAPGTVFGIVIVSVDVPPAKILLGANALLSVMCARPIVRFAVAGAEFVTPSLVLSALAAIVFV